MSAGAFENGRYQLDNGDVARCRAQPESKALAYSSATNAYTTDAVTRPGRVRLRQSKRSFGVIARSITVRLPATGQPTGYKPGSLLTIPIFTTAFYDALALAEEVTYLGVNCELVSRSPEIIR